jgi:hypothetical protein
MSAKAETRRPSRRRPLRGAALTLLVLLALAAGAHALAWRRTTDAIAAGLADWTARQRAMGWTVEHGPPVRAGWPFEARIEVAAVTVSGTAPALPRGFTWEAARVALAVAPPRLDTLAISATGAQRLRLDAAVVPFAAHALRARVPLDPAAPAGSGEILAEGLVAMLPEGPLAAARIAAVAAPRPQDGAFALSARAEDVLVPPVPAAAAFGPRIAQAWLEAAMTGPMPPPGPPARAAEAWRDAGGAIELGGLALRWGPLAAELNGVLRLDAALQPAGEGRLAVERPQEALAALVEGGLVPRREAGTLQAVLALTARAPAGGGAPRVELPVSVANGAIAAARIPLLRLPPLAWPGAAPQPHGTR